MIAIRLRTLLVTSAVAACLAISSSSHAQDECLKGDVNLDGTVNMSDWLPMFELVFSGEYLCEGDNGDGEINFLDLAGIQQRLLNQQGATFTNTVSDGVGDFFWSTSNLNEGAVNGPISEILATGQTLTLYLYYSTAGPSNSEIRSGYSINVATSANGIVEFTQADTLNYSLQNLGRRWNYPLGNDPEAALAIAPAQSVESDLIVGLTGMGTPGGFLSPLSGISNVSASFDTGYDSSAQAFLVGRIQLEAVAPGTIELNAGPNELGIADQYDLLQSAFARATVSVSLLGDVDLSGEVDFLDIPPFISVLSGGGYQFEADMDGNGAVNFLDIPFMITALGG